MAYSDLWVRDVITCYGSLILVVICFIFFLTRKWPSIRRMAYNSYLTGFEVECAELAASYKAHLFKSLSRILSNDQVLRSTESIRVLEIGVKTGENIQFYPKGTHLIGVDWNIRLGEYLVKGNRSREFSHVIIERLIIGDGSSMSDVPNGSVDAVITTRSLCSVSSIPATLREIQRVLAPGGKYFFMEHLPEHDGTFIHWCQKFLAKTGIWGSLFGGCRLDFDPIMEIKKAGFEKLVCTTTTFDGYISHPIHLALSRQHVFGVATRATMPETQTEDL